MTVDNASRHSQATGMKTRWLFVISVAASSVVCQALAHDTWLLADQMRVAPKATVTLDLTSGMAFPALDVAPKRESIPNASGRLGGRTLEVSDISAAPNSLQFKTELSEPGSRRSGKLPSRTLDLKPEQVAMFNEEVNAPESLQKEWAEIRSQTLARDIDQTSQDVCSRRGTEGRHLLEGAGRAISGDHP